MGGIELSYKYRPLWEADYDYAIITGGRGSAKSFAVGDFLENLTFEKGHNILFTRYTMISAEISVIPEFNEKIILEGHEGLFDINKKDITNKLTGSKILFRGLKTSSGNQTANLKSIKDISTLALDEAEELQSEKDFDKLDESIRVPNIKNRIILILNPASKEHFIYKRFFIENGVKEGFNGVKNRILYIHTDYRDNIKHLSDKFLAKVEEARINRPDYYKHIILGGWLERSEGVVFEDWSIGEFDTSLPYGYGLDFGYSVDPDALTKIAIDKKKKIIYLHEEIYQNKLSTSELAQKLLICGSNQIVADSAEPRLINDIRIINPNANIVKAVKGADSVRNGIKVLQDYTLVVTETSINIHKELNNYVWHDKKSDVPIDAYNHALDGIRYYVTKQQGGTIEVY